MKNPIGWHSVGKKKKELVKIKKTHTKGNTQYSSLLYSFMV